jgi:hypothetical protein
MKFRTRLTITVLTGASVLYACSSSSGKKNDSTGTPPAGTPTAEQPTAPQETPVTPGPAETKDPAVAAAEQKKKATSRYNTSLQSLVGIPAGAAPETAKKALEEHFLAIECGVHIFGEEWSAMQQELLKKALDTPEKQEAYVRAQSNMPSPVLELHPEGALDSLCQ